METINISFHLLIYKVFPLKMFWKDDSQMERGQESKEDGVKLQYLVI